MTTKGNKSRVRTILVAEDNEQDRFIFKTAFARSGLPHQLIFVVDGVEAILYLTRKLPFSDRKKYPEPDLVFLDLHMPGADGFEVLRWKHHSRFRDVPTVLLSGSQLDAHKILGQKLGAKDFYQKRDLHALTELILQVTRRWLSEEEDYQVRSPINPAPKHTRM